MADDSVLAVNLENTLHKRPDTVNQVSRQSSFDCCNFLSTLGNQDPQQWGTGNGEASTTQVNAFSFDEEFANMSKEHGFGGQSDEFQWFCDACPPCATPCRSGSECPQLQCCDEADCDKECGEVHEACDESDCDEPICDGPVCSDACQDTQLATSICTQPHCYEPLPANPLQDSNRLCQFPGCDGLVDFSHQEYQQGFSTPYDPLHLLTDCAFQEFFHCLPAHGGPDLAGHPHHHFNHNYPVSHHNHHHNSTHGPDGADSGFYNSPTASMHDCNYHDAPFNPHFQPCAEHECCTDAYAQSISQFLPSRVGSSTTCKQPMRLPAGYPLGAAASLHLSGTNNDFSLEDPALTTRYGVSQIRHSRELSESSTNTFTRPPTRSSTIHSATKRDQSTTVVGPLTCSWTNDDHICTLTFTTPKELQDHYIAAHIAPLDRTTLYCRHRDCTRTVAFSQKGKLIRHMCAHSFYKEFLCPTCGSAHTTKEQLKNHLGTHSIEKPYKCEICGRGSGTKTQHDNHVRTHTKEKPFRCEVCGVRHGDSSNLSKHVKKCHPEFKRRGRREGKLRGAKEAVS